MKVQTKFSSNNAFVTGTFPDTETPQIPEQTDNYELPVDEVEESGKTH